MMRQERKSGTITTGDAVHLAVPDPAAFNGLLLVDATLNHPGLTFSVAVFAIWHGEAIKIESFENEDQARAWLADAVWLVEWNRSDLTADPSSLYLEESQCASLGEKLEAERGQGMQADHR